MRRARPANCVSRPHADDADDDAAFPYQRNRLQQEEQAAAFGSDNSSSGGDGDTHVPLWVEFLGALPIFLSF